MAIASYGSKTELHVCEQSRNIFVYKIFSSTLGTYMQKKRSNDPLAPGYRRNFVISHLTVSANTDDHWFFGIL